MTLMFQAVDWRRFAAVSALLASVCVGGCGVQHGPLEGRASDQWQRSYTLQPDGELQIVGGAGTIEVVAGAGPEITVRADRIVKASTDAAAAPLVSRVRIAEDVAPEKIVLRSEGLGGILIGVEVQVDFHVTVPPATRLRLHASDGGITLSNLEGIVVASSTNGSVTVKNHRGGLDARSTNGSVTADLAAVPRDPVDLRSVNGTITLTLPRDGNANIEANTINGAFDAADLAVERLGDQTRRRARLRLNDGGRPIELSATNGDIHIRPRP
jgi:hypothetical protein